MDDFWYRYEWQARGSGHVHGVLWLRDCPKIDDDHPSEIDVEALRHYFNDLCSAFNPCPDFGTVHPSEQRFSEIPDEDKEIDLIHLLNRVQKHTMCGNHCLRKNLKTGKLSCRYKFPKPNSEQSTMEQEGGVYTFVPLRNDGYIQRYNHIITSIWRANTDFSPISSIDAVMRLVFLTL